MEGIPLHAVPAWLQKELNKAIARGPHVSACTPDMTSFILGDMEQKLWDGLRILLLDSYTVKLFRDKLNLSCIATVSLDHFWMRLILNLNKNTYGGNTNVNGITYREFTPESMESVCAPP